MNIACSTRSQDRGWQRQTVAVLLLMLICSATSAIGRVPTTDAAGELTICSSRAQERRSLRRTRVGKRGSCTPKKDVRSSSLSLTSSSVSVPSSYSSRSSTSSQPSIPRTDTLSDVTIRSQHLLLGQTGPIIGAANIFIEAEPLDVRRIAIQMNSNATSLYALLIYDEKRQLLGRATVVTASPSGATYLLELPSGTLTIGKREDINIYVRPQLLPKEAGGTSGQTIEINNITIVGDGIWSSQRYTKALTDRFLPFSTARSVITSIEQVRGAQAILTTGKRRELGSFRFTGRVADASAHIDVADLAFTIESTGGATISHASLRTEGIDEEVPCFISASIVTCTSIPDAYGALRDGPRTLTILGDVTVSDLEHASLRLTLNDAGSITSDGAVRWSDGSTTFGWLGLESPLAIGTLYKY